MTTQHAPPPPVIVHAPIPQHLTWMVGALSAMIAWWAVNQRSRLLATASGILGEA